jgi:hypothetical protein
MKSIKILLITIFFSFNLFGQECIHTSLSNNFDFKINLTRIKTSYEFGDSCTVTFIISSKDKKSNQQFTFGTPHLYDGVFKNCENVRSNVTGLNKNNEVIDNDFGDLIVEDFNFDSLDDFAIKNDSGGNGGPTYSFYIQNISGQFEFNDYLASTMEFFPSLVDKKKMTLTTFVHTSAYKQCKTIFLYDLDKKLWVIKKRTFVKA